MQFLRFVSVGALNTTIGLAIIWTAMAVLRIDYRAANAIGYAIGAIISFALNRSWTFRHTGNVAGAFARWLVILGLAWLANIAVVMALHAWLRVGVYAAQIGGIATYTACSFLGARYFAFSCASHGSAHIEEPRSL